MTRFNTTEEVSAYAAKAAAEDYQRHIGHGIDLNPFCTDGARNAWQRGFDGKPARSYEIDVAWDSIYQRGFEVRKLFA